MEKMEKQIEQYSTLYGAILDRIGDSDAALVILEQLGKDRRMEVIREERQEDGHGNSGLNGSAGSGDAPATSKQIAYLKSLGGSVTPGMTKAEASAMIDALNGGG